MGRGEEAQHGDLRGVGKVSPWPRFPGRIARGQGHRYDPAQPYFPPSWDGQSVRGQPEAPAEAAETNLCEGHGGHRTDGRRWAPLFTVCRIPTCYFCSGLHATWTWSELEPLVLGKCLWEAPPGRQDLLFLLAHSVI